MKKSVFITGVTGTMGYETLKKFMENRNEFNIRILARKSAINEKKLAEFGDAIETIWGDLEDDDKLCECVKGADYVLHIGAFVSPFADAYPEQALRINLGSTLCMLKAIRELGQADTTHFVYVGTVAQTGDRQPPLHWGRIGDPMKPSIYDYYALSKVASERAVMESGLKYWASIRQTGMLPLNPGAGGRHPIISHQPYNNVIEWSNAEDSGNLMRNICTLAPAEFWGRAYNLSNGDEYRNSCMGFKLALGSDPRLTQKPKWMARFNFHGHFYLDADDLETLVPFRTKSFQQQIKEQQAAFRAMAAPGTPRPTVAEQLESTRKVSSLPGGVLQAIDDNDEDRIKVWFGSREAYEAIPDDWDDCDINTPVKLPKEPLKRGFDETKPHNILDLADMQEAAKFRGGECLSVTMVNGDLYSPLKWRCADGHEFSACPYTILFAGHWCPECLCGEWRYGEIAETSPFFAQVWTPLHKGESPYRIKMQADAKAVESLYQ